MSLIYGYSENKQVDQNKLDIANLKPKTASSRN